MAPISYLNQKNAQQLDEELMGLTYQYSIDQLMELAGLSCAAAIEKEYAKTQRILVVAGPGNNGGDGLVCARHLSLFGYPNVTILYPKVNQRMGKLVRQCESFGVTVLSASSPPTLLESLRTDFDVVVDAMFGFSFHPPIRAPFDTIIEAVKESALPVVSVDIPSGWDVEKGNDGCGLNPAMLISLSAPKECAAFFNGTHYLGGRFIPPLLAQKFNLQLPSFPAAEQVVKLPQTE